MKESNAMGMSLLFNVDQNKNKVDIPKKIKKQTQIE